MKSEANKGLPHKDNVILRGEKHFDVSQNASLRPLNSVKKVQNKKEDFGLKPEIPQFESLDSTPQFAVKLSARILLTFSLSSFSVTRIRKALSTLIIAILRC